MLVVWQPMLFNAFIHTTSADECYVFQPIELWGHVSLKCDATAPQYAELQTGCKLWRVARYHRSIEMHNIHCGPELMGPNSFSSLFFTKCPTCTVISYKLDCFLTSSLEIYPLAQPDPCFYSVLRLRLVLNSWVKNLKVKKTTLYVNEQPEISYVMTVSL